MPYGGQLQFGPRDGFLYLSTGDGGGKVLPVGDASRRLDNLLGKILRIKPLPAGGKPYDIPRSNPYVGKSGRPEIYAYGLRQPWRFSFNDTRLTIADVGEKRREEVNYLRTADVAGVNFGGPKWEGDILHDVSRPVPDPATFPIFVHHHGPKQSGGACAIIGGYVVHYPNLPTLLNRYLYGDLCTGDIRSFVANVPDQVVIGDHRPALCFRGGQLRRWRCRPVCRPYRPGCHGASFPAACSTISRRQPAGWWQKGKPRMQCDGQSVKNLDNSSVTNYDSRSSICRTAAMAKTGKREPATSKSRQESGAKRRPLVEDPAALIGLLSKVVNKLQEHSALKSEEIGLAEWTALRAIAAAPSLPTGGIARQLGVSRQRSTQIVQALGKAGLVTVGRASGDQRKKQLIVTDAGRQKLQRVDTAVDNLLKRIFKEKPKAAGRLGVTLTALLRTISPAIEKRSAPPPAA